MKKKRYNSKSRTVSNVEIDNSTTNEIAVDIEYRADKYNSCNALVLPSKKRKTKREGKKESTTKLLSKKRRKQLEKVVERKQKKLKSAKILEELAKVQVPAAELQQYVSFTSLQNKGLKRHFQELKAPESKLKCKMDEDKEVLKKRRIDSIKGSNKKKKLIDQKRYSNQDEVKRYPKGTLAFEKHHYYFESSSSDENNTDNESKDVAHVSDSAVSSGIVLSEINDENNIVKDAEDKTVPNKSQELKKNDENNMTKDAENKTILNKSKKSKKPTKEVQQESITPNKTQELKKNDLTEDAKNKTVTNKNQECKEPTKEVEQQNTTFEDRTPAVFVPLNRKPEIQAVRLKLPIAGEEYDIMDLINENPVVIITGETGSGKTTQIPQFLYERGYAQDKIIGITEPRRVAAMSMSKRVAEEMNLPQSVVSYQIRYEGNFTEDTKIKFMTDGILLKEIQTDFLLTKYSVIILDEAHERSVFTDVLIGLMSRIVRTRNKHNNPLKLIIMSATLRIEEFVENRKLFKVKPPVFNINTRQYEVTIHFNRTTSIDYLHDAVRKAMMIHVRLPEGGILVFLTGQREVETAVQELRKAFPSRKNKSHRIKQVVNKTMSKEATDEEDNEDSENDFEENAKKAIRHSKRRGKKWAGLAEIDLDDYSVIPTDEEVLSDDMGYLDEDDEDDIMDFTKLKNSQPMWVLPLYSLLPAHEQAKVFKPPPEGHRLCVVCTNVAETSLTIPNIKYVVDSGRYKEKIYDKTTSVSTFKICYVSKASATQRTGRAGRTGPGHCYRLYSSAVYNEFKEYGEAEILKKPIDDLLLQIKAMKIVKVVNFPFPTPPDMEQLKYAEKRLTLLGLLKERPRLRKSTYSTVVTSLGRSAALYPVAPRYSKMLLLSHQHDLLKYTICIVAALSVQQVLIDTFNMEDPANRKWLQTRHKWAGGGNSLLLGDAMVLLKAIGSTEYAISQLGISLKDYCEEKGLRHKAMVEVRKLRQQLTNQCNLNTPDLNLTIDPEMPPPTELTAKLLRQVVLGGMVDQVAKKVSPHEMNQDIQWGQWINAYKTPEMEDPIYMQSSCVLHKINPEWVVYQELYETNKTNKMYMRGVTAIQPEWLPMLAPDLCHLSEPLTDPPPRYDEKTGKVMCRVKGTFGRAAWTLPPIDIEYPSSVDGVKWFLYFFLNGQVCPKLKKFVPSLESTPDSVTKIWARLVPHIQDITQVMSAHGIMTKDKLLQAWDSNNQFLLSNYKIWLPESLHAEVALIWPPT